MDMSLYKSVALLLFFAGTAAFVYAAVPRKTAGGLGTRDAEPSGQARIVLLFKPFYLILLPLISRLPLRGYRDRIRRMITTAGLDGEVEPDDIIGFQVTTTLLFVFMSSVFFNALVIRILAGILGFFYPYLWLREQKTQRQQAISLSMPDVVDMLSLSVEAGLSFNAAVQKICDIYRGEKDPFVQELYLMDKNIRLGRSSEEALKLMAERVDLMELDSFASTLIQAGKMGSSISPVLRSQAERMRAERFMKAERLGAQASQKLLIPMMIFIFPIIFIIIFGPYIVKLVLGQ
jgi:tight adherence protein C